MSDARERLKKLLDGDLEASDIAEDASLVSLADRLYGIKIANVKPVKKLETLANNHRFLLKMEDSNSAKPRA